MAHNHLMKRILLFKINKCIFAGHSSYYNFVIIYFPFKVLLNYLSINVTQKADLKIRIRVFQLLKKPAVVLFYTKRIHKHWIHCQSCHKIIKHLILHLLKMMFWFEELQSMNGLRNSFYRVLKSYKQTSTKCLKCNRLKIKKAQPRLKLHTTLEDLILALKWGC